MSKTDVLVDESSTVSGKSCLIVHTSFVLDSVPTVTLLDIVELPKDNAETIVLKLTESWLDKTLKL